VRIPTCDTPGPGDGQTTSWRWRCQYSMRSYFMDTTATPNRAGASCRHGTPSPQDGDRPRGAAPSRRSQRFGGFRLPRAYPVRESSSRRTQPPDPLLDFPWTPLPTRVKVTPRPSPLAHSSDPPLFVARQRPNLYSITENSGSRSTMQALPGGFDRSNRDHHWPTAAPPGWPAVAPGAGRAAATGVPIRDSPASGQLGRLKTHGNDQI
jgi:hypothetical protein